jgi:anaerobic magnesium-protoporphyrin IX monomethyl ester cyclase
MRILLTTLNAKYIHTNLAIRLLYDLNHEQHEGLAWKEFTIKENRDEVAQYCADFQLIAFSCYIWNITQTLEVCAKIKALNPNCKILLGGPEVSYDWQDVISRNEIDFIITGEGEIPFRDFLNHFPNISKVPSLVYKTNDGDVHYNSEAPTFDLNELQGRMPYSYDNPEELKNKVLYLETSRGCPYKCEFCLASLDNKVRYLPNATLKETLLYLMQHGKVIKFLDRTFNMKRDFTLDIFQFILENHRPENVFQFEITADILHPDIIKFIQEKVPKNLFRFEIGIQTVNQIANLEASRKQNFEKTKSIIRQVENHVELHLDLIVGMALDYWDDIKYSFEEVFKLFAPELQLGFLKFLKGTPTRYKAEQHEMIYDPNPPYQIIESKYLTRDELYRIELLEHALEIYWNKPRAIRTLKYAATAYSSFDFLMGLGIFFSERQSLIRYNVKDIYLILFNYAKQFYPNDKILQELISIDYCTFERVKPTQGFVEELPRAEKYKLLEINKLNHNKYRFVVFPISFNLDIFDQENRIDLQENILIFQFDGVNMAKRVITPIFSTSISNNTPTEFIL